MKQEPTVLFCVGATKAGTSWFYHHLAHHPDCHLRTIKELHYFDMLETGNFARYQKGLAAQDAALAALAAKRADKSGLDARRQDLADWLAVVERQREDIPAYLAYLNDGRDGRAVVADITPAYALLPEARLRQMARVATDVRFVYLLRDPVARLWSQARMVALRAVTNAADFPAKAIEQMSKILDGIANGKKDREDYVGALTRLAAAVPSQRLMVMFQDEMMTPPGLARLSGFLGISARPANFARRVLEGAPLALAADLRERARAVLRPQYDFVARQFPNLPESWHQNMCEVEG